MIELVVTFVLLSILVGVGLPSFVVMVANVKVRTVAEVLQNGLRLSRAEALHQNRQSVFALTTATPSLTAAAVANGNRWSIITIAASGDTDGNTFVQGSAPGDETSGVATAGPAAICFNANGRLVANAATGQTGTTCSTPTAIVNYDVTKPNADHPLRVTVTVGGQIRLCDPARSLAAGAPDGC